MKIPDKIDQAVADAMRARHALAGPKGVLLFLRDAMVGQPQATGYDSPVVGGHSTVLDERGVPMPAVSDPTGEAGVIRASGLDQAVNDHQAILRHVQALASHADALDRLASKWQKRAATEKEKRDTDRANDPGCELHLRHGTWRPPKVLSSTVKGTLERPYRLCDWCMDVVGSLGRVPSDDELRDNIAGKRLRRTA